MAIPYELMLGWRYTRSGRASRRNGFISFISGVSMLGIALGVAALIIVLSVMNGFQKEVRDRMLGVISHIEVQAADGGAIKDLNGTLEALRRHPAVVGAAPFVSAQALLARGEEMKGAWRASKNCSINCARANLASSSVLNWAAPWACARAMPSL
jgi:lipoprotein-releasing system permease protein